ncbi:MAG: hypothetical protein AB1424_05450 [Thermodesulfobacteriota bacterium]
MKKDHLSEKEEIEKATGEAFIRLYNEKMGTSFRILEHSDAPDFRCLDSMNNPFNFDVTLTEDLPKDIAALCGRSNHRDIDGLKEHMAKVKEGKAHPLERVSSFNGNVTETLINRISKKLNMRYGKNTALVVRDTSRLEWDWSMAIEYIKKALDLSHNTFDKGIWVISNSKDNIFRIV